MFKLRKREDYFNPSTTVTRVDLEGIICASDIVFKVNIQDYNAGEVELPSGDNAEIDYLGS